MQLADSLCLALPLCCTWRIVLKVARLVCQSLPVKPGMGCCSLCAWQIIACTLTLTADILVASLCAAPVRLVICHPCYSLPTAATALLLGTARHSHYRARGSFCLALLSCSTSLGDARDCGLMLVWLSALLQANALQIGLPDCRRTVLCCAVHLHLAASAYAASVLGAVPLCAWGAASSCCCVDLPTVLQLCHALTSVPSLPLHSADLQDPVDDILWSGCCIASRLLTVRCSLALVTFVWPDRKRPATSTNHLDAPRRRFAITARTTVKHSSQ